MVEYFQPLQKKRGVSTLRLFCTEWKRAVFSKRFLIAVIGYGLLLCLDVTEYWNNSAVYIFCMVYKTAFYMMCFTCAALPFADSFLQDYRSGAWRSVAIRTSPAAYCAIKPIVVFLSGFLAVVLASGIFIAYLLVIFPVNNDFYVAYSGYDALLNSGLYFTYFGVKTLLTAGSSAMMAVISLMLSNILKNTYAVLAAPVVLYYIQNELGNFGIIPHKWQLTRMLYYPIEDFGGYAGNITMSLLLWCGIAFVAGMIFFLQARRMLKNA